MKSNSSNSIEVNLTPNDFKNPRNNISSNINLGESKTNIKHGLLSRTIIHIVIFSYISSKLNFNLYYIFSNIPLFTINKFEFYRLITNFFFVNLYMN